MKAGDVKCPKCGAGFADVAPDYELDPSERFGGLPSSVPMRADVMGTCRSGHMVWVRAERVWPDGSFDMSVRNGP